LPSIWRFLTDFGDTAVTVPLAILVTGVLLAAKEPRLAVGWAVAIVGCATATAALKLAFTVCGVPLGGSRLFSPSGHTAMSIAVYGGLAAVVGFSLERTARVALLVGAGILTLGIALSRVIVGYHTPIEVVIGLAVGFAALGAIVAMAARYRPSRLPIAWLIAGMLAVFVLFHGERWPAERALHRLSAWLDFLRPWCS
jgi:membrane-associated phospholipid phosphatase